MTQGKLTKRVNKGPSESDQTKISFFLDAAEGEKLKAVIFWERTTLKDLMTGLIKEFLEEKGEDYIENVMAIYQDKSRKK